MSVVIQKSWLVHATALFAAGGLWFGTAFAQAPVAEEESEARSSGPVDRIVVTGSRIQRPNLESVSPVVEVESEKFDIRGAIRAEQLLNRLPQITAAATGKTVSRATAQVNLRGVGPQRTLVLVNGNRLPYGSPVHLAVDINQIPLVLLDDVEVLTGGASAVYGSDALAGVVNFKLRDDFEGVRFRTTFSGYQHHNDREGIQAIVREWEAANPGEYVLPDEHVFDGFSQKYSIAAGLNLDDGRGNVAVYATYRQTDEVKMSERDYTACQLGNSRPDGKSYVCRPSQVDDPASFVNIGAPDLPAEFRVFNNQFVLRQPVTGEPVTDRFNAQPYDPLVRPHEQYSFGGLAHYELNEHFIPFIETNLYQTSTASDYAPGGIITNGIIPNQGALNCDNPFFSAQQADFLCTSRGLSTGSNYDPITGEYLGPEDIATGVTLNYRTTEHGTRHLAADLTSFRMVTGFRGTLVGPFDYKVAGTYADVRLDSAFEGDSDIRNAYALNAVIDRRVNPDGTPVDPITFGQPACAVNVDANPLNDRPDCVPMDLFSTNGPSPESIAYTHSSALVFGNTTLTDLVASVTGDLLEYGVKSPFSENGVGVALGVEYRENVLTTHTTFNPNTDIQSESTAGGGSAPSIHGETAVEEVFGELVVPIVEDQPLLDQLSFEGAYRYSSYEDAFSTDTFKLGINWSPVADVRFRGSFQRAVRAPNVIELFEGQQRGVVLQLAQQPNGTFDPCSGPDPFASLEQCVRTGVDPADYGTIVDNSFVGQLEGGNPDLGPETAETYVLGVVLQPSILPRLTASIDYYNIEIDDLIGVIDPNITLGQCLNTGNPFFCDLIQRGAGGTLFATPDSFISTLNVNTGSVETSGIDLSLDYPVDLSSFFGSGLGDVQLSLRGTYLDEFVIKPLPTSTATETFDCAGYHGFACEHPKPVWRHILWTTWRTPWQDVQVNATWRYISEVDISLSSEQPALSGVAFPVQNLSARSYLDLSASWPATDYFTLRAGVNNVFDEYPAITTETVGDAGGRGNTYGSFYDNMGRFLFVTATFDF